MQNRLTPALCLVALVLVLYLFLADSITAFHALLAVILPAWVLVIVIATDNLRDSRSVAALLNDFAYQVDRARQNIGNDPKAIDQSVQAAFDKLHAEVALLLRRRKIRMAQVKREVLKFHDPGEPLTGRWRPPTLSEMGYVLAAADRFAPDAAVLALYRFSGEQRDRNGTVADTYTILKEGSSTAFSAAFDAKIQSPYTVALTPFAPPLADTGTVAVTAAPAHAGSVADSDHNVGYILSLLGPVTPLSAQAFEQNLRAIARHPAKAAQALPADLVWGNLRSLMTEPMLHREDVLAAASNALRQAPHLLVCAVAGHGCGAGNDNSDDAHCSVLTVLAEMLAPANDASRAALATAVRIFASSIRRLAPVRIDEPIANPGYACVEARGAEADAGLLKCIAQLLSPAAGAAHAHPVIVVTNLTQHAFQQRLSGYGELSPGADDQAVIDTLLAGLQTHALTLHTVAGVDALKAQNIVARDPQIIVSCDPALVDVEGLGRDVQYLLWTAGGRALRVDTHTMRYLPAAAQEIRDHA
jgi:hypothetical protein